MGKAKRNAGQQPMDIVTCFQCGAALQPEFEVCPYCGTDQGEQRAAAPASASFGPPSGARAGGGEEEAGGKTMAIDISTLGRKKRELVGWLVATNGNHRGEDFKLYDGKNVLGTAADCDIVITDPYLSSKHCTVRHENGNFVLIDLDSTNGTFVNQKRVTKMEMIDNDTVRLGRTEFKFKSLF